jgi:hypothetical protein
MKMKIPGAKWTAIPAEKAAETYDLMELSGGDVSLDNLFGEVPEQFYLHKGNLRVEKKLNLYGGPSEPEPTVYVIDGDLTVDGPLVFENMDVYTTLLVTGSLRAKRMSLTWDACLFVCGSLTVDDLLFTYLTDAGNLVVRKQISAKLWLEAGGRGNIQGKKSGETKRLVNGSDEGKKDAVSPVLLPAFLDDDEVDPEQVKDAILAGKNILR